MPLSEVQWVGAILSWYSVPCTSRLFDFGVFTSEKLVTVGTTFQIKCDSSFRIIGLAGSRAMVEARASAVYMRVHYLNLKYDYHIPDHVHCIPDFLARHFTSAPPTCCGTAVSWLKFTRLPVCAERDQGRYIVLQARPFITVWGYVWPKARTGKASACETRMSDVVTQENLVRCFRDRVSSGTNEEGALRLLSQYLHPKQVREIKNQLVLLFSDDRDSSLLHYACRNGWYDVSRQLVEKYHCDAHLKNRSSYTPLHYACTENGNIDIVRFLVIDQHCYPACRERWDKTTPLHHACKSGKLDIIRFLVEECHCDPGVQDSSGETPLHYACTGNGNIDIVRFLVVDQHCT